MGRKAQITRWICAMTNTTKRWADHLFGRQRPNVAPRHSRVTTSKGPMLARRFRDGFPAGSGRPQRSFALAAESAGCYLGKDPLRSPGHLAMGLTVPFRSRHGIHLDHGGLSSGQSLVENPQASEAGLGPEAGSNHPGREDPEIEAPPE
jgi:hypothetical protein